MFKNGLMMAAVLVFAGCGMSQTEVAQGGDELGQDGAELSTTSRSYVTFTRDMRKCLSPVCGGYFVTDVNRVSPAPHYVSGFDFTNSKLDDATIAKALEGGTGEVVLRGKLGAADPTFHTRPFIVSDAWRGMPGELVGTGDAFYSVEKLGIVCFTAPCPTARATKLNAGGTTQVTDLNVDNAAQPRVDKVWLQNRILGHNALVAAKVVQGHLYPGGYEKNLTASQVFVKLPEEPGPCPQYKLIACPSGQVRNFTRNEDRCELPAECVTPGVCPLFVPNCGAGYSLQSWSGGQYACQQYACDPTFSL